jgi:hypothetical protein
MVEGLLPRFNTPILHYASIEIYLIFGDLNITYFADSSSNF